MEYRILGPTLTVLTDSAESVTITRRQVRHTVWVLALHAESALPYPEMIDLVLGDADGDALQALRACVSRARTVVGRDRIQRRGAGYLLTLEPDDRVDLLRFRDLHERGRTAHAAGNDHEAVDLMGRALALWGEPALGDAPRTPAIEKVRTGLLEERATVREELILIRLALGRHRGLIPDLQAWVGAEPYNERLRAHLMRTLYLSGYRAEALRVYEGSAELLAREAREPSAELRAVRDALTAGRGSPAAHNGTPARNGTAVPHRLPDDVHGFTGRAEEQELLVDLLSAPAGDAGAIVTVTGPAAIGKTALAIRVGRRLAGRFPDGQLYVDLAGSSSLPRDPGAVLGEMLLAIGRGEGDLPGGTSRRAGLWRSHMAGRRMLIVVDDAETADQVTPLLPMARETAVIVVGRPELTTLSDAAALHLEPMRPGDAWDLFARVTGRADPPTVRGLADICAGSPLALRIIGAALAHHRPEQLRGMLGHLRQDPVTEAISVGYRLLDATAARALRMLSLVPGDFAGWLAAMVLGVADAGKVIATLVGRGLLTVAHVDTQGQVRYRMHDLIRRYAADRLNEDPRRCEALIRLGFGWMELVDIADRTVPARPYPIEAQHLGDQAMTFSLAGARELVRADPAEWLRIERAHALATTLVLAGEGQIAAAFGLALRLSSSLYFSGDHEEAERMWLAAADAADGHGDHHTAATCRLRAAIVLATDRMRPQQAAPLLDSVVMTLERHGDLPSLASAQAMRAYTTQYLSGAGRSDALDRAERDARTAALLARKVGNPHAEFAAQRALGLTLSKLGRDEDAIVSCRLAARTAERVEMPAYRGLAMWSLAEVYHRAGEYDLALGAADEGLAHTGAAGHDLGIAYFHRGRGRALAGLDRHDEAAVAFTNAVEAFERQCLMELAEECRLGLAQVHRALDHEA